MSAHALLGTSDHPHPQLLCRLDFLCLQALYMRLNTRLPLDIESIPVLTTVNNEPCYSRP